MKRFNLGGHSKVRVGICPPKAPLVAPMTVHMIPYIMFFCFPSRQRQWKYYSHGILLLSPYGEKCSELLAPMWQTLTSVFDGYVR